MKTVKQYIQTGILQEEIREVGEKYPKKRTILVDFCDLERFDQELADSVRNNPMKLAEDFEEELTPTILTSYQGEVKITIGFRNIPLEYSPHSISEISEQNNGQLMRLEAVISQATDKYPFITEGLFICNRCDEKTRIAQKREPKHMTTEPTRCRSCGKHDFRLVPDMSEWDVGQVMILTPTPTKNRT